MSSGERPIGAAKGKQSDTEAFCQRPAPPGPSHTIFALYNLPCLDCCPVWNAMCTALGSMQVNPKSSGIGTRTYCTQHHSLSGKMLFAWLGPCSADCLRGLPDGEEDAGGHHAAAVQAEAAALKTDNTGPLSTEELLLLEYELL